MLTAPRSPWESPYLERAEPVIEYLQVENRGLGNNPIELGNEACRVEGSIACRNRFSGMLRYYCRQTAGSAPHRNLWIESEPRPVMELGATKRVIQPGRLRPRLKSRPEIGARQTTSECFVARSKFFAYGGRILRNDNSHVAQVDDGAAVAEELAEPTTADRELNDL